MHRKSQSSIAPRCLLVDTSESLFNLLGQSVQVALDLLLVGCVGVFKLHLRELKHDVGGGVSDLGLLAWPPCMFRLALQLTLANVMSLVSTARAHASW